MSTQLPSIAFIGTGVMGRSMAGHLRKAGHALHVYNRTKEKAAELLAEVRALPNLRVRGLMTILHPVSPARAGYERLAELFHSLCDVAPAPWDTLSMGMSDDFETAVQLGASHVRIGSALFGER